MKRILVGVVVLAATLVAPGAAGGQTARTESYALRGVLAEASYRAPGEPQVDVPFAVAVFGANARLRSHRAGSAPVTETQPSGLAVGMLRPGPQPGDEPVPMELWGAVDDAAFTYDRSLTHARLHFSCIGEYLDPMNDDTPTGETVALTVTATWTGVGPLRRQHDHNRFTDLGSWSIDRANARFRAADAHLTISTPDGVLFDGTATEASINDVKAGSLLHTGR